jgi:hypothetical protein
VRDREIDDILKKAAQAQPDPGPALLSRIAASMQPTLRPVRPLPPTWVLACGLGAICLAVAMAGAAGLGFYGVHKMSGVQTVIFAALAVVTGRAAMAWIAAMIPGSRRQETPAALLGIACVILLALFAILFPDLHTVRFMRGVSCLEVGVLAAIPAALAGWLLLRRGFAVDPAAAGIAAGTLAGLAGITMLEFHCPNFQMWHVLVWHTAVLPISAAVGALVAWLVGRRNPARD